jgi:hypothetical protein
MPPVTEGVTGVTPGGVVRACVLNGPAAPAPMDRRLFIADTGFRRAPPTGYLKASTDLKAASQPDQTKSARE